MKNVPLFDAPPAPQLTLSKALAAHKVKGEKGTYSAYRPVKRVQCGECVNVLHEAKGKGEPPRGVTTTRRTPGGTLHLCTGHARLWRELDGIGEKPQRAPRRRR